MAIRLGEILKKFVDEQLGVGRVSQEMKLASIWPRLQSNIIRDNAFPDKLVGGVLFLSVKNSAWAQQVNMMKPEILSKLNEALGKGAVKDIRLKTGYVPDVAEETKKMEWHNCPVCGAQHVGAEPVCFVCGREKKQASYIKVYKMADKDTSIKYSDIKSDLPDIREEEFRRIKRDVISWKSEQTRKGKYGSWKK